MEALHEAGIPAGVLNYVTGAGGAVGNTLVEHPAVRAVSFTGSCEVGNALYEKVTRRKVRVQLEMGGKNPTVVLKDADLDYRRGCPGERRVFLHRPKVYRVQPRHY